MVRLFRTSDLPPDIPGMIITDGDDTAVLINAAQLIEHESAWVRELTNSLLAAVASPRPDLRAVVGH